MRPEGPLAGSPEERGMQHRKDKRFAEPHRVLIRDRWAQKDPAYCGCNAQTHDLSVSGARIRVDQEFPVGYVVRIVIDLEETGQSVEVDGEVVWTRRSEDGVRFDVGVEFLHNISNTIVALIAHFYGKKAGIPSTVC